MADAQSPGLVRAIGRWTLVALVVNSIVASGIFGLPKDVGAFVGEAAWWACLVAAVGMGIIMFCFAEVASQFREAGGPYLYAREAFGRFMGIEMGWLAWLVRLTAAAANANLFVVYLGEFWPGATSPIPRAALLTALIGMLALINIRGVKGGANLANVFTVAKLLPLTLFGVVGAYLVAGKPLAAAGNPGTGDWLSALLVLMFAYGGFEAALMPMGEAKDPRRDAPFALLVALVGVTLLYTLVHLVVVGALAQPGEFDRPLAAAARVLAGGAGAAFVTVGALISIYGYLSGQMVSVPRLTYAFAERRDFPDLFAAVHPKFQTPHVSIILYSALLLGLALYGSFVWNVILSSVARLFTYALVCASVIVFRAKRPHADSWRMPAGELLAGLGVVFCGVLALRMGQEHMIIIGATILIALANWLWARRSELPAN